MGNTTSLPGKPSIHPASASRGLEPALAGREIYRELIRLNQEEGIFKGAKRLGKSHPYCGVRRILIELESEPKKAQEYAQKYANLVDDLAKILATELGVRKTASEPAIQLEGRFFSEIWSLMLSNLDAAYGRNENDFLYESLDPKKGKGGAQIREWDCDTSAFLVFDVGRKIGLEMKLVFAYCQPTDDDPVEVHTLVKSPNLSFQSTTGRHYPVDRLEGITDDLEIAQSVTYYLRGNAERKRGSLRRAVEDYETALRLNCQLSAARANLEDAKNKIAVMANRPIAPVLEGREAFRKVIRLNQSEGICKTVGKFGRRHPYCGVRRILIELESEPKKAQEYAQKYSDLVDDLAKIMARKMGIKKSAWDRVFGERKRLQIRFFAEMWSLMRSCLGIEYGRNEYDALYESLDAKKSPCGKLCREWDCDNTSFLVFDVGRKLGLDIQMVFAHVPVPNAKTAEYPEENHVLVKTRSFSFETTNGKFYPIGGIWGKYPKLETITRNMQIVQSVTYNERGNMKLRHGDLEGAIEDFGIALKLNKGLIAARKNLSRAKEKFSANNYYFHIEGKQETPIDAGKPD